MPVCCTFVMFCRPTSSAEQQADVTPHVEIGRSSHAAVALDQQLLMLGGEHKGAILGDLCMTAAMEGAKVCMTACTYL